MKKLLVVSLVLAVASLANATLTFTLNSPTQVALGSTDTSSYSAYVTVPVAVSYTIATTSNAGGSSAIAASDTSYGDGLDWRFITVASNPANNTLNKAGQQVVINITAPGLTLAATGSSNQKVTLWDESGMVEQASFFVVPEPATMALLGLGGLLFARRK